MINVWWKKSKWLAISRAKNRSHSCFFHQAALPLTKALLTISYLTRSCGKEPVAPWSRDSKCFPRGCRLRVPRQPPCPAGVTAAGGWACTHGTGVCQVSGVAQASQNCPSGFLHSQATISPCHVISGIVFRTVRLGGGISFPRGCDEFAVGDLWQLVLGKCCARPGAKWLREAINSLRWEAYVASITWIINFTF